MAQLKGGTTIGGYLAYHSGNSNLSNVPWLAKTLTADKSDSTSAALSVTNSNGFGSGVSGAIVAEFIGNDDALQIINNGDGDYFLGTNQQYNGINFKDGTGGVEILYNSVKVQEWDSAGGTIVTGSVTWTGGGSANANTAYSHSQDNSQAHSDYLINNGDDTTSGKLTATGGVMVGGTITSSAAILQVNGFQRTGNIYLHPSATPAGTTGHLLENSSATLKWNTATVWTSANLTDNHTNWDAAFTHKSSTGADHSYINQSLVTTASPTFSSLTVNATLNVRGAIDLADSPDVLRLGSSDDVEHHFVGASSYYATDLNAGCTYWYIRDTTTNKIRFTRSSGQIDTAGDVVAYSTSVSDKRLKENINTLDTALDKVLKLRGVNFEWKKGYKDGTHIGYIAQEIEEIIPEVVVERNLMKYDDKVFKVVRYEEVIPYLSEAIKEQQNMINDLKEEIKTLKNKIK